MNTGVQISGVTLIGTGASAGDTSITINQAKFADGTVLNMSHFGAMGVCTLDQGTFVIEEQISFTGITHNADNTQTLTGVRSVNMYPTGGVYNSISGLKYDHHGNVPVVFSDNPLALQLLITQGGQIFTGNNTFSGTNTFTGVTNLNGVVNYGGNANFTGLTTLSGGVIINSASLVVNTTANFSGNTSFTNIVLMSARPTVTPIPSGTPTAGNLITYSDLQTYVSTQVTSYLSGSINMDLSTLLGGSTLTITVTHSGGKIPKRVKLTSQSNIWNNPTTTAYTNNYAIAKIAGSNYSSDVVIAFQAFTPGVSTFQNTFSSTGVGSVQVIQISGANGFLQNATATTFDIHFTDPGFTSQVPKFLATVWECEY